MHNHKINEVLNNKPLKVTCRWTSNRTYVITRTYIDSGTVNVLRNHVDILREYPSGKFDLHIEIFHDGNRIGVNLIKAGTIPAEWLATRPAEKGQES